MRTKTLFAVSLIAAMGLTAFGQNKSDSRVKDAGQVLSEIMHIPDNIPQDLLDKAECVIAAIQ